MFSALAPHVQLADCVELDDRDQRCLAPAVVDRLPPMESTSGPVEFVATRCLHGYVLRMPTSMLALTR